ncbi:hypothetical protein EV180_005733 [Coemansia sp. RSA 518]|nr:hypothetical protein LPJ58_003133 [Coemansia sp. RSA 1591]KAJ1761400.1 hypothetical protein LPJ69_003089 [Coemansia sp. RSA 1752]KAJ1788078.1 hypothetical protein LPJ67_002997 [Coemansia sp. RSA 1938]KAJ2147268.1 hypothetical protein IW142_001689 [Coemansia sp. RSA 564]KAJ2154970.1 hypothetical protein J3F82_000751 [Coemansia sp. RSA 637]KAJ2169168.1 hypothetical protein GGH15_000790 [Coemansia sp. RSA 562]KAJ2178565.1 hypothetical protein EV181_006176 [Coemansia sp. RSA 532]KAJ2197416.1 
MDSESSYWDLYLDETDYISPPLGQQPTQPKVRGFDDSGSSRDSYWSRYSAVQSTGTAQGTPMARRQQRRLLVVPDRLAALHLSSDEEDDQNGDDQILPLAAAHAGDCGIGGRPCDQLTTESNAAPLASPCARVFTGVNPMALITRLTFLKEQMEQDERLLLNPVN